MTLVPLDLRAMQVLPVIPGPLVTSDLLVILDQSAKLDPLATSVPPGILGPLAI